MTTTDRRVTDLGHLAPIGHDDGMALFAVELRRNLDLMRGLDEQDWSKPTDCPAWDVRLLYLHVLGACESGASIRELLHQLRAARAFQKANGGPQEAALSSVQVAERLDLSPDELIARFGAVAPRAVRTRTRLPSLLRRASLSVDGPVAEKWTLGYLVDVIYLRDAWMHRVDASRATGVPLVLTASHDGRIVADVAAEWARRHGRPVTLELTGAAGGRFTAGGGTDEPVVLDAVEFCRVLAGRERGEGLLATIVPF
ncbi:MAG: maleylpyruvate isomerase family mycothiol-dependent enzyme [Actinomycetota bacterium]|nr:maleylpyruvate isomerase family mycothiol-dependent enzyme [Actinomycetota bacterium]